ncbi:hypothetical protein C8R43DRAFT_1240379 [Mycena crocata]|nr:hypothetical protein C8R43DRAFT_1240379 [Mycena crocata]
MGTNDRHSSQPPVGNSNVKFRSSALRSRLDAIQFQMTVLESQMALLHAERESVLQHLAGIVYPVLTLPTDITSEIFLQYVKKSLYPDHTERKNSPLRLANICRAWRATAISTCRIWTLLDFGGAQISTDSLSNCLQFWLPRVGSLTVDLHIKLPTSPTPESDGIIRILDQHSTRWGTLEITSDGPISFPADIRGPFSALTKIGFRTQNTEGVSAAIAGLLDALQLREVELCDIELVDWQTSLPWSLLTTLDLWDSHAAQCLGIIPHTPNLEHLLYRSESEESPNPFSSLCVLRQLKSLLIVGESSGQILTYLAVPALENLYLTPECAAYLRPLIARSGCSPRILELIIYDPDYMLIYTCISSLPTIRELRMTCDCSTYEGFNTLFTTLAEDLSVLPALESLHIDECETSIDLLQLERMLSARLKGEDGVAKLKSFRICFTQEEWNDWRDGTRARTSRDKQVDRALDRLRKLRSQGLSLEFPSSVKWDSTDINSQMIKELDTMEGP